MVQLPYNNQMKPIKQACVTSIITKDTYVLSNAISPSSSALGCCSSLSSSSLATEGMACSGSDGGDQGDELMDVVSCDC